MHILSPAYRTRREHKERVRLVPSQTFSPVTALNPASLAITQFRSRPLNEVHVCMCHRVCVVVLALLLGGLLTM